MRHRKGLTAALVAATLFIWLGYRNVGWIEFRQGETRLLVDLAHPDALIRTASLSRLPRDLLRVPIARDVLTEDLAFYYEQHEDRLGFSGSVKRIAYEHKLDWLRHSAAQNQRPHPRQVVPVLKPCRKRL